MPSTQRFCMRFYGSNNITTNNNTSTNNNRSTNNTNNTNNISFRALMTQNMGYSMFSINNITKGCRSCGN